jgi:hypothetical protein
MQHCEVFYNHFDEFINTLLSANGEYLSSLIGIYSILLIGLKYKQILITRRDDFVNLGSNLLLNYIDDTTTTSKIDESTIRQAQLEIERIEQQINIKEEKSNVSLSEYFLLMIISIS